MSEMRYCYSCQTYHPESRMRLFQTRAGLRWRCLASIEAARASLAEREQFGREQSRMNSDAARELALIGAERRKPSYSTWGA